VALLFLLSLRLDCKEHLDVSLLIILLYCVTSIRASHYDNLFASHMQYTTIIEGNDFARAAWQKTLRLSCCIEKVAQQVHRIADIRHGVIQRRMRGLA
jgi:hypothetical protein